MRTDVSRQCRLTPSRRCRDRFRAIKSPKQTRPRSSPRELAQHVSSTEHVSLIHCVTYGVRSLRAVVGWAKARNTPCPRRRCAGHGAPIDFCYSARSEQRAFAHPTTALFRPPTLAERATAGSSPPNRGARRRVARNDAENDVPKSRRLFRTRSCAQVNELGARCDSTQSHRALVCEPESSHDFRAGAPHDESGAPSNL